LTSEFAKKYEMTLRLSEIPIDYPFQGPLYFHEAALRELFNYGADCAQRGKLWTTVEQALDSRQKAVSTKYENHQSPAKQLTITCPLGN
jgi:hypothetical protein